MIGLVLLFGGVPRAAADTPLGALGEGQSVFWDGSYVSNARVSDPNLCGIQGPCFNYTLKVASAHAKVLRAALRTADDSNGWGIRLIDPSGHEAASGSTYTLDGVAENFDVEVWAHDPAPGTWTVQVIPENVQNGTFQTRAAVDPTTSLSVASTSASSLPTTFRIVRVCRTVRVRARWVRVHGHLVRKRSHRVRRCARRRVRMPQASRPSASPARGVHDVPPDIAADAPWHLTFDQPLPMVVVESGNFTAMAGLHNSNASVFGQQLYSCLPEETLQQGAHHCLRFTSGFASLGPGPFEVYGQSDVPVAVNGGPLYQVIHRSDGTSYSRRAGTFIFHQIHAHYHVVDLASFEVFRVVGDHSLVAAAQALKQGFCLGNIKLYDWHSFNQPEIPSGSIDNCEPNPLYPNAETHLPTGWRFYEGIANGWEDSYKWQTSGQFASFAGNPDGRYVLRVTVNPNRHLLESDAAHDTNDVAYTYFQVTGNDIHVIERGHGTDPWDPAKKLEDPNFGE